MISALGWFCLWMVALTGESETYVVSERRERLKSVLLPAESGGWVMEDFEKMGAFYLGRTFDQEEKRLGESLVLYPLEQLCSGRFSGAKQSASQQSDEQRRPPEAWVAR